jgi:hypothetical protein
VAKTRRSPIEKRIRKPFTFLHKKAPKQNAAPRNVVTDRSCKIKGCRLSELLISVIRNERCIIQKAKKKLQ